MNRRKSLIKPSMALLLTLAILAGACQGRPDRELNQRGSTTQVAVLPQTGTGPSLSVHDQASDGRTVEIEEVVSNGPGWLVIYTQEGNQPGLAIGYAPVRAGVNQNVLVRIDPVLATEVLYAVLHQDAGQIGTYEYPGLDIPQQADGQEVSQPFQVFFLTVEATAATTAELAEQAAESTDQAGTGLETTTVNALAATTSTPSGAAMPGHAMGSSTPGPPLRVNVVDQEVTDGSVVIESATSSGPSWIVIYSEQDGQPVEVIGFTAIQSGENRDIMVNIDPIKATPGLFALLHHDAGQVGAFEYPGPDGPVLEDVRIILDRFNAGAGEIASTPPSTDVASDEIIPSVIALDQPIRGGTVKVSEAVSNGPGWLGIHIFTPDGEIGSAIGSALLVEGSNKEVVVKIDYDRATEVMNAMIHFDGGEMGVWEYPGPDGPVLIDNEMVMQNFNVTGGLIGEDVTIYVSGGETPFLVDGQGMSLYVSLADKPGRSMCDAECHKTWLPLLATGKLLAGENLPLEKLGVTVLTNNDKQVTYNGLPLYYYAGDIIPGDIKGQGIDGQWFLAMP